MNQNAAENITCLLDRQPKTISRNMKNGEVIIMADKLKIKNGVRIRPMETEDIGAVIEIDQKIKDTQGPITYYDPTNEEIGGELEYSVVAENSDKVVGFIFGKHLCMGEPVSDVGLIKNLEVDPDYNQQDIATDMVDLLLELYRSKGLNAVQVMVSEGDTQIKSFFTEMDFSRGRRIDYIRAL
jgi:ribosomal protein S18 acetylase RimI-like enzyme